MGKRNLILGIDIGTTNVKGMLFTEDGCLAAQSSKGTYTTDTPHVNWAEQNADLWWENTADVISDLMSQTDRVSDHVIAVGISSQGAAMLPIDSEGRPLRPAIIWMDRRSAEEAAFIESRVGREKFIERFGSAPDPTYVISKLLWFRKNEPELFDKTYKVMLTNGYVNYRLTGELTVDATEASSCQCFDNIAGDWSCELEQITGVPIHDFMPRIVASDGIIGTVNREASERTGLPQGVPVIAGTADAAAALYEVGLCEYGEGVEISGTSSNIFFTYDGESIPNDVRLILQDHFIPTDKVKKLLFGAINNTGASLKWYARELGRDLAGRAETEGCSVYQLMDRLAVNAEAGSRGIIYFPYLLGERAPLWNDYVKGMFIGFTSGSEQADMIRSLMEGTSYALRHVRDHAVRAGAVTEKFYVSGGCANSDIWLKIKASILDTPLHVMSKDGGSPLGDAIMAAYGIGLYSDYSAAVENFRNVVKVVEPEPGWVKIYDDLYGLYISMREHLDTDLRTLNGICKANEERRR